MVKFVQHYWINKMKKKQIGSVAILFLSSCLALTANSQSGVNVPKEDDRSILIEDNSVKQSGTIAADQNSSTSQITGLIGAGLTSTGINLMGSKYTFHRGLVMFGMGVLAFQQSAENSRTAGQAADFASQFDAGGDSLSDGRFRLGDNVPDVTRRLQAEIEKNPYVDVDLNKGIMTTKDGQTHKLSDFSTPAAMAAGGFNPDDINSAMKKAKELEAKYVAKYKANELGLEGGGGGGGSSLADGSGSGADGFGSTNGLLGRGGLSDDDMRLPANQMAGMQKDFNGDPIGVSADSIFLMMTRRYEVKKKQDSFFDEHQVKNRK